MKLLIDIPKEFEQHFQVDRFYDSLHRLSADAHLLAGLYEKETVLMLSEAFKNAIPVPPHGRLIDFPCDVDDILYEVDDPSFGVIVCKVYSVNYSRQRARLAEDAEMRDCVSVLVKVIDGHGIGSAYSFSVEDFGKSIFLTREEAEAAINAPTIIPAEEGET